MACVPGNSFFADLKDGRYFLHFCYVKEMLGQGVSRTYSASNSATRCSVLSGA